MSKDSEHSQEGTQEHPETPTVEIDGQQVSLEEVKKGYLRQSDYTRKMQELSNLKKTQEPDPDGQGDLESQLNSLAEALVPRLQSKFASKQDMELEDFLQKNPELEGKRKLLLDLSKTTDKSYWDIAEEYELKDSDALEKSKSRKLVGDRKLEQKPQKKLSDLSPDEYAQWRKDNLGKSEQWKASSMRI